MKKLLIGLALLLCVQTTAYAEDDFFTVHYTDNTVSSITYNNEAADFAIDGLTLSDSGTVCVPVRAVSEFLGKEVIWNDAEQSVMVTDGATTEKFVIDSNVMYVNGEAFLMEDASVLIDDYTYVPLDFLCRGFGISVWYTPSEEPVSEDLLGIRIEPTSEEDMAAMLYDKYLQGELLEDEMNSMLGNSLISDESTFSGSDIPAEYEDILSQTSFSSSQFKAYTVEDIQSQMNQKDMLADTIDLSDGAVQFEIPDNGTEVYQYESVSFNGQENPVLIEYLPKQGSESVPVYLKASSVDDEQKVFIVGCMYCPDGQRTAAIIDGLRSDRVYNIMIAAQVGTEGAVVRVAAIDE